jgi:hypothetical protein
MISIQLASSGVPFLPRVYLGKIVARLLSLIGSASALQESQFSFSRMPRAAKIAL